MSLHGGLKSRRNSPIDPGTPLSPTAVASPGGDQAGSMLFRVKSQLSGSSKVGWSRYLIFSTWLIICGMWTFLHFIQGSHHVAHHLNPGEKGASSWLSGVDSFSGFLDRGKRFPSGEDQTEGQVAYGREARERADKAGGGVGENGGEAEVAQDKKLSAKTASVGKEKETVPGGRTLTGEGWQDDVTAGQDGGEGHGRDGAEKPGGPGLAQGSGEASEQSGEDRVDPSEAEEMRRLLKDVAEASESYVETPALIKDWSSADYAGKEDEEGDKGASEAREKETSEGRLDPEDTEAEAAAGEGKEKQTGRAGTADASSAADRRGQLPMTDTSQLSSQAKEAEGGKSRGVSRLSVDLQEHKGEPQDSHRDLHVDEVADSSTRLADVMAGLDDDSAAQDHAAHQEEGRETELQTGAGSLGGGERVQDPSSPKAEMSGSRRSAGEPAADEWEEPPVRWTPPAKCGTVEEMGAAAAGDHREASLRVRRRIREYLAVHGGTVLRTLPEAEFCQRSFVVGKGQHDGIGNNVYKILTAAGLAIMLNRSIILGEQGRDHGASTHPMYVSQRRRLSFPFGDYVQYSSEMLSMQEVKQLWVKHGCSSRHGRKLRMTVESFVNISNTRMLCDDWTRWTSPVVWLADALDAVIIQWFLKNRHPHMRQLAEELLGKPWDPDSRPNTFGELSRALLGPNPLVQEVVNWTLGGGPLPDFALHMRMMSGRSTQAVAAVVPCLRTAMQQSRFSASLGRKPRLVVVADSPEVLPQVEAAMAGVAEVVYFDYQAFVAAHPNHTAMSSTTFTAPKVRVWDWGPLPRWVAIVEFFLAASARWAFISAGGTRVATTFAQLCAGHAAAHQLDDSGDDNGYRSYSSLHKGLLDLGLARQSGRGHAWHTFGGPLSCRNQERQCALTPLLPYAWWDAPWQSPIAREIHMLQSIGLPVTPEGRVAKDIVGKFCQKKHKPPLQVLALALPHCKNITVFDACTTRRKKRKSMLS